MKTLFAIAFICLFSLIECQSFIPSAAQTVCILDAFEDAINNGISLSACSSVTDVSLKLVSFLIIIAISFVDAAH